MSTIDPLTPTELLDKDAAIMLVGFVPAALWLLWLVISGAWNDLQERRRSG